MARLDTPLADVVGGRTAKALERRSKCARSRDLLGHYPRRMAERGELTDLASLRVDDDVTVMAEVRSCKVIRNRNRAGSRLEVVVGDGRGTLEADVLRIARRPGANGAAAGTQGLFAGKVGVFSSSRQLAHPEYMVLRGDGLEHLEADDFAGALIPVYPATKEMRTWQISNTVRIVLAALDPVADPLPAEVRARHSLVGLDAALRGVHRPDTREHWHAARRRLKWDEALGVQLALAQRRAAAAANPATPRPAKPDGVLAAFDARLPFTLTAGQREVGDATRRRARASRIRCTGCCRARSARARRSSRCARCCRWSTPAGRPRCSRRPRCWPPSTPLDRARCSARWPRPGSSAAPTRATRVALLTGSLPAAARKAALLDAASGAAGIVVGTHALIQEHVSFADLGLVVVDEQHRFGVEQRDALRGKAKQPPHLLVMTATPIPRTVAMTVFGDLETSTLTELPAGRSPISTTVVPVAERPAWLERAWQRIREEVAAGRQAFVVCPRIGAGAETEFDPSDAPADDEADRAAAPPVAVIERSRCSARARLHGLRLGVLHGGLPPDEKDRTMARLRRRATSTCSSRRRWSRSGSTCRTPRSWSCSTPTGSASRSCTSCAAGSAAAASPGLCLLVTDAPPGAPSRERLDAVAATTDGFELARLDVEQRREGDVLGAAQSGPALATAAAVAAARRGPDRRRAGRGGRPRRRRSRAARPPAARRAGRRAGRRRAGRIPGEGVTAQPIAAGRR